MIGKETRLVVMIPAYNEAETIRNVIRRIPKAIKGIDKIETLVINDGSSDNTSKIVDKYK